MPTRKKTDSPTKIKKVVAKKRTVKEKIDYAVFDIPGVYVDPKK